MRRYEKGFAALPLLLGIVVLALLGGLGYFSLHNRPSPSPVPTNTNVPEAAPSSFSGSSSPTVAGAEKNPRFGIMLAFNINDAVMGMSNALQKGWTEFKKDSSAYQNLKSNLEQNVQSRTKLVKATSFSLDRELVPYFTWNVIEPSKGQFDWDMTDTYVQAVSNAGMKVSAVIQPFASWDQRGTAPLANCNALDFAYYDYKVGPPNDLAEYENFLTKTVERYKNSVAVWEVGNEYDGPCGGYENNPKGYFDMLKITSETIKKADPNAIVANGGASEMVGTGPGTTSTKNFWTRFFALGGGRYIDYFNFHYNTERSQSVTLDPATFQEAVTFLNDLMDTNGGRKPLYLTEFGVYSGSPSSQPPGSPAQAPRQTQILAPFQANPTPQQPFSSPPPQSGAPMPSQHLKTVSQEEQAVLYFKDTILAFANGVRTIFIDLRGGDGDMVGSSMAFDTNDQPRLFLTTLKTISNNIGGFSKVEKIAEGQYKFIVNNKTIYAVWAGTLPKEISGQVKVTDIKGQERTMNASAVTVTADQPILVEYRQMY